MHTQKNKKNNFPRFVVKTRLRLNNNNSNVVEVPRFNIKNKFSQEIHYIFESKKNNTNASEARAYDLHEFAVQCFFSELIDLKINLKYARNVQEKHLSQVFERLLNDRANAVFANKIIDSMQLFFSMI